MTTYADPSRCPDCHAALPPAPSACPACDLPLVGPTATHLFRTFQEADRLLARLRAEKAAQPALAGVGGAATGTGTPTLEGVAPYPVSHPGSPAPRTPHLRGASVPQILLGLGALCLLVAAITFLAVAWSWLGVGGRTLVLVGLTAAAFGLTAWLRRRGLRTGAEALSVVGFGLLALDVVGARHAGWFGHLSAGNLVLVTGGVVAAAAMAVVLLTAPRPMVAPAVVAPVATLVAGIGTVWAIGSGTQLAARMAVVALVLLGLSRAGRTVRSRTLGVLSLVAAVPAWCLMLAGAYDAAHTAQGFTLAHLWGGGAIVPLAGAAAVAAAAGPIAGLRRPMSLAGYAVGLLVGGYALVTPALDNGLTAATSALLALTAAWVVVAALAPRGIRAAAVPPLLASAVVPVFTVLALIGTSVTAVAQVGGTFTQPFGVHVAPQPEPAAPWLLMPCLLVLLTALLVLLPWVATVPRAGQALLLGVGALLGTVATLPLYDVPLALVVGALAVLAAACLVAAERVPGRTADALRIAGAALALVATFSALPNDLLTSLVLAGITVAATVLMARTDDTGAVAAVILPLAFGGLVWSLGSVASVDEVYRAVPVLLVLGALVIWRPQVELELSSLLTATLVSAGAVLSATDQSLALAVHLTVAGALITATSLVHPSRRQLAWLGGLLLAMATWVRLADLGVHTPEAYTLPSAVVLTALGAWRVTHDDRAPTLTFLGPGLVLATVPSLLAVLDDPVSPRAALLGGACLVLVLAGVGLRWSAPLLVGGAVGAVLVLRELAPYAAVVPTWVMIGIAGTVLLVVGLTWESRLRDARTAARYVTALR